ncbi:MAG: hypothetical protein KAU23_10785 [Anaerolineales bacterium]|nr:hypothetical protein [Anaerolineales bacterium]
MNENKLLNRTKRVGTALTFIFYPILAGVAFAVHPNLLSLSISHDIQLIQGTRLTDNQSLAAVPGK